MAGRGRDSVKVKIIMTQFIQTDAQSFKSVVQRLTGRDSTAAATAAMTMMQLPQQSISNGRKMAPSPPRKEISHGLDGSGQLEEMEKWFLELPSFDDEFLTFGIE